MKKTINIILVLILTVIMSSCFTSKDDVDNAKKELGIIELDSDDSGSNINDKIERAKEKMKSDDGEKLDVEKIELEVKEEIKKIEIIYGPDEMFLEFDDMSGENIFDGEVELTGKTSKHVDKIVVTFSNVDSDFPDDEYTLKQFTPGAETFLYRAFSRYETLDFGKNIYTFIAYSGNETSKAQININVVKEEEKKIEEKIKQVYEDLSLDSLPTKETFGTPMDLGNGKVTYSDLKGLEIRKEINSDLTCENLTEKLVDSIDSWFFWNTCRPIEADEGISFFVIRLDGDNYVYEKHYYLSYQGIYGVQELKIGTGVTDENIGEKNTELKGKNEDFVIIEITDDLFKEILK